MRPRATEEALPNHPRVHPKHTGIPFKLGRYCTNAVRPSRERTQRKTPRHGEHMQRVSSSRFSAARRQRGRSRARAPQMATIAYSPPQKGPRPGWWSAGQCATPCSFVAHAAKRYDRTTSFNLLVLDATAFNRSVRKPCSPFRTLRASWKIRYGRSAHRGRIGSV